MHNKRWEELIPFYVAGTLSKQETAAFEKHLATCAECQNAVNEWNKIASAVRAEAASQLRDLPPLAPALQAQISGGYAPIQRYGTANKTAHLPPLNIPLNRDDAPLPANITRVKQTRISFALPFTLAAAAAMVLLFGVILGNMNTDHDPSKDPTLFIALSAGSETPEITDEPIEIHQTVALTPTHTATPPTQAVVFATSTPSPTPTVATTSDALKTIIAVSMAQHNSDVQQNGELQQGTGAQIVVSSTTINLRQGPSTDYPILEMGEVNNRYNVIARIGSGANTWYEVERPSGGTAWVFGTIVKLEPANAQIPFASNVPSAPVQPTSTPVTPVAIQETFAPIVSPTIAAAIRSGAWTHITTIAEHQCGGEIGVSRMVNLFILPSIDLSSLQVTYTDGATFTLYRANSFTYTGSYPEIITEDDGTVLTNMISVSIIFNTPGSYTGQETILYDDSCIMRSTWSGSAVN